MKQRLWKPLGSLQKPSRLFSYANSALQTDSPEEMHGWIRDIEMKIQDFRGPSKVNPTPSTQFYNQFLLFHHKEDRRTFGCDQPWWCVCLSHRRVSHLNVHPLSMEARIRRLEGNRPMSADPHCSSRAPLPPAGSRGCPSRRVSHPFWT